MMTSKPKNTVLPKKVAVAPVKKAVARAKTYAPKPANARELAALGVRGIVRRHFLNMG